jgi:[acyl-carrier-protein] S-malonyltransferase
MKRFVCLFPGQGSQFVGMGKDLFERFAEARDLFARADEALGFALSRLCFEGPEEELRLTRNTQPALLTVSTAAFRLLGAEPVAAAGHSLGEYSAQVAAGVIDFEDAVRLVHRRGVYMQEAVPAGSGGMAAVLGADADSIVRALEAVPGGGVSVANWNSPDQVVIAGPVEALDEALRILKPPRAVMLPVSAPFHTAMMRPAEERLAEDLARVPFHDPAFPVVSNVDARLLRTGDEARDALRRQVSRPVLWTAGIEVLRGEGPDLWVEVGPGKVLSGLIKRIGRAWPAPPAVANVEDAASLERTKRSLSDVLG